MTDPYDNNRARWRELVPIHVDSEFYDVDAFAAGRCTVGPLELEALGDLDGRRVLHLQCHFGLDTMSLARLGAVATGVDYAEPAITEARRISAQTGIDAEFVCADVYRLDEHLTGSFDVVYASHGVLIWLPDLTAWAEQIARRLRVGGFFYLIDEHPLALTLSPDADTGRPRFTHAYFRGDEPIEDVVRGSYANRDAPVENDRVYFWIHPVSDLVNALTAAGLAITRVDEYPWAAYKMFPAMKKVAPRQYRLADHPDLPYLLAIRAERRE